jgi:hypothetical protein
MESLRAGACRRQLRQPAASAILQTKRGRAERVQVRQTRACRVASGPFYVRRTVGRGRHSAARRGSSHQHREMPKKPNYNFEKRRKEMARKEKQEEKRARKREAEEHPEPNPSSEPDAVPKPPPE